ncbi:Serine/threonine-protein kinase tousled-like 2 [Rhizophlyctis rosea]|uniref:Serine/threonine-protein kinase tousled-like 2 n=1 Tax=Rhizophlyctis rosea TaxID=64517 RepID=A0AAD5S6P7_9FUNG|nr:Serine/threonine-protein kinase tousled-like 2 [Rhizophlyctis rosea]
MKSTSPSAKRAWDESSISPLKTPIRNKRFRQDDAKSDIAGAENAEQGAADIEDATDAQICDETLEITPLAKEHAKTIIPMSPLAQPRRTPLAHEMHIDEDVTFLSFGAPGYGSSANGGGGGGGGYGGPGHQSDTETPSKQHLGGGSASERKKKKVNFTDAEDEIILQGVAKFGESWEEILHFGNFDTTIRTPSTIRGRWHRLNAKKKTPSSQQPTPSSVPNSPLHPIAPKPSSSNHSITSQEGGTSTFAKALIAASDSEEGGGGDGDGKGSGTAPNTPKAGSGGSTRKIHDYFRRSNSSPQVGRAGGGGEDGGSSGSGSGSKGVQQKEDVDARAGIPDTEVLLEALRTRNSRIREMVKAAEFSVREKEQLQHQIVASEQSRDAVSRELDESVEHARDLERQLEKAYRKADMVAKQTLEQMEKARQVLITCLTNEAVEHARKARSRLHENSLRLATVTYERHGVDYHERWKEGYAFVELQAQIARITKEKEELDKRRRLLTKRLKLSAYLPQTLFPPPPRARSPTHKNSDKTTTPEDPKTTFHPPTSRATPDSNTPTPSPRTTARTLKDKDDTNPLEPITSQEYHEQEEIIKLRLAALKKEEGEVQGMVERLGVERDLHVRESRRVRDEDESRFNHHPVLNERYLLLKMIGKGGFSEVYKAFDLVEMRSVACKIHSLSDRWSEERKTNYIKHSLREYRIHKELHHPRVVRLFDVFEFDYHSFCTILEFCEGRDLESHLQMVKTMPEREAKSVVVQVLSALKYLNEGERSVIHFDLKPGGSWGCLGRSKVMEENEAASFALASGSFRIKEMELTSQGAGTYWYLPPEVFTPRSQEPIKISSKVDVWSLGCIFYELLYGVKPFGNDRSQHTILQESTIMNDALHLTFPGKPVVGQETKDFIKRCLEYRKEKRPDVLTLAKDPYVNPGAVGSAGGGAAGKGKVG